MANKPNPMQVQHMRAAGTPTPGKRQKKNPTKKQAKSGGRVDNLEERVTKLENNIEKAFNELNPLLQNIQQEMRVRALETHVALDVLGQNVCGRESIESLMQQRAPQFGLQLEFRKEKVDEEGENNDENTSDESSEISAAVPPTEEYKGTEGYSG